MDRYAAVLIPIDAADPHEVTFIQRATHLRRHAGQIAFPGGAVDPEEAGDHERTALREAREEIGLPPSRVTVVGRLPAVRQRTNAFTVTPFVGIVRDAPPAVLDANEVAAIYRVPLAAILAPGAVRPGVEVTPERLVHTFHFDYGGLHVWGLTGRILDLFVARYRSADSALRRALDDALAAR